MSLPSLDGYSAATLVFIAASAFLAGLGRGFSGFGAALIFMPLASTVISPKLAAPLLMMIDLVLGFGLVPKAWPKSNKRDIAFISLGALVGAPAGALLLARLDPVTIRWSLVAVVLPLLLLLMSGWRYHGQPNAPLTVGTGVVSGFLNGVAQVGGPPVVVYWLGGRIAADLVRANIIGYFAISSCISFASYLIAGLLGTTLIGLSLVTGPVYALGLYLGAHMFGLASETTFRRVCYGLIAASLTISLPIFDGILR